MTFTFPPITAHVGRVVLASLFILGGVNKIINYGATLLMMQNAGLEPAAALLPLTIILELGGGLLVAFGRRFSVIAAIALALFTVAVNFIFHRFWMMEGQIAALELSLFFKNVAVIGGLIFVAASLNMKAAEQTSH
jgi:putative oxidoreductase